MADIVALGELLIDFLRVNTENGMTFRANAGGAPGNVLACASRLGASCAFIGKIGNDMFGEHLVNVLNENKINTDGVIVSDNEFTTLAFVSLDEKGDRSFSFARKNSADVMLRAGEVNTKLIDDCKIFHCGSLSMTHPLSSEALVFALERAKNKGKIISADPNYRPALWQSPAEAKAAMSNVLGYADIVKISDYELQFMMDENDISLAAKGFLSEYPSRLLFVTCGEKGAYLFTREFSLFESCLENIKTVDTTGAGDCFCGAALTAVLNLELNLIEPDKEKCRKLLRFANIAANLSTQKEGAIPAMPELREISEIFEKI